MLRTRLQLHRIDALDVALCLRCNRVSRYRGLRSFFRAVSRLGDGVFWYALMAALPIVFGESAWPVVLQMIVAGTAGVLLYKWLKSKTLRPRPYQAYPDIVAGAAPLDSFSFPSGHTLHAVSFSLVACTHFPALEPVLFPFAALVALSRPILGLHYPSDVLAGAAIGAVLASIVLGI